MLDDNLEYSIFSGLQLTKPDRTLPIALLRAREAVMERIRPMLQKENLTEQQWRILRVLQNNTDVEATALAEAACILPPSVTRMLRSLEAQGLVETRKGKSDRRRLIINLSRQGHELIRSLSPEIVAMYSEIEQIIGGSRMERIVDELEFISKSLRK